MTVISTVAPIFALICIGYVAGRSGLVSDQATKGLSEFTFTLAIPAMLFRKMATATLPDAAPLAILSAYLVIGASIWCASYVVARHFLARSPLDSVSIAKSSVFGNVVMLGIPLSLAAFGEAAAAPIAIIIAAHSPVLWLASAIQLAWVKRQQQVLSAPTVARDLAAVLLKNAIILAVLAGTLWQRTGIGLPPLIDKVLILLGSAGIPCALVALGLSLVRFRIAGQTPTLTMILCLKLIAMPIFAILGCSAYLCA